MKTYEEYKEEAIAAFSRIYKDSLAFDLARVPKEVRIRLLEDPDYTSETRSLRADLYAGTLKYINDVLKLEYSDPEKGGNASEVMKALEMRNKLLFSDLNIDADESNALNITFIAMRREDFEAEETVEIQEQKGNTDGISLDFGDSEEEKVKIKPESESYGAKAQPPKIKTTVKKNETPREIKAARKDYHGKGGKK